jgi:hypothetical protein
MAARIVPLESWINKVEVGYSPLSEILEEEIILEKSCIVINRKE